MNGDVVPQPDPTALTTAALVREIANLQKQIDGRFQMLDSIAQQRDAAIREVITGQVAIRQAELSTVDLRFELIERQRIELKSDSQVRLDAALLGASGDRRTCAKPTSPATPSWCRRLTKRSSG